METSKMARKKVEAVQKGEPVKYQPITVIHVMVETAGLSEADCKELFGKTQKQFEDAYASSESGRYKVVVTSNRVRVETVYA